MLVMHAQQREVGDRRRREWIRRHDARGAGRGTVVGVHALRYDDHEADADEEADADRRDVLHVLVTDRTPQRQLAAHVRTAEHGQAQAEQLHQCHGATRTPARRREEWREDRRTDESERRETVARRREEEEEGRKNQMRGDWRQSTTHSIVSLSPLPLLRASLHVV